MKNITKKLSILLLLILLTTTMSFSSTTSTDSIVSITTTQLKKTNLIFAEHSKLLKENELLKRQIDNYKEDNKLLIKADSVRVSQISNYKEWNSSLNKSLKNKNKSLVLWKIGGITICSSLILLLLLK